MPAKPRVRTDRYPHVTPRILVSASPEEIAAWDAAAARYGEARAVWARRVLNEASRKGIRR